MVLTGGGGGGIDGGAAGNSASPFEGAPSRMDRLFRNIVLLAFRSGGTNAQGQQYDQTTTGRLMA